MRFLSGKASTADGPETRMLMTIRQNNPKRRWRFQWSPAFIPMHHLMTHETT
jgi:hypothetical protein